MLLSTLANHFCFIHLLRFCRWLARCLVAMAVFHAIACGMRTYFQFTHRPFPLFRFFVVLILFFILCKYQSHGTSLPRISSASSSASLADFCLSYHQLVFLAMLDSKRNFRLLMTHTTRFVGQSRHLKESESRDITIFVRTLYTRKWTTAWHYFRLQGSNRHLTISNFANARKTNKQLILFEIKAGVSATKLFLVVLICVVCMVVDYSWMQVECTN